jgi:hypothetical protein
MKLNMKNKTKEQLEKDALIRQRGEDFLKKLRALPYAKTNKNRSFVILPTIQFKDDEKSER